MDGPKEKFKWDPKEKSNPIVNPFTGGRKKESCKTCGGYGKIQLNEHTNETQDCPKCNPMTKIKTEEYAILIDDLDRAREASDKSLGEQSAQEMLKRYRKHQGEDEDYEDMLDKHHTERVDQLNAPSEGYNQ